MVLFKVLNQNKGNIDWRNLAGEKLGYTNWQGNSPNHEDRPLVGGTAGCVKMMGYSHSKRGQWSDNNCNQNAHEEFVCMNAPVKYCGADQKICHLHATCENENCVCKNGYFGDGETCEDLDECASRWVA